MCHIGYDYHHALLGVVEERLLLMVDITAHAGWVGLGWVGVCSIDSSLAADKALPES